MNQQKLQEARKAIEKEIKRTEEKVYLAVSEGNGLYWKRYGDGLEFALKELVKCFGGDEQ